MAAYVIGQTFVPDPEKIKRYIELAPPTLEKYGGIYLARGGEMELLEGKWEAPRMVVTRFESMDAIRRWYHSPEYTQARKHREGLADFRLMALEGVKAQP